MCSMAVIEERQARQLQRACIERRDRLIYLQKRTGRATNRKERIPKRNVCVFDHMTLCAPNTTALADDLLCACMRACVRSCVCF